MKTTNLNTWEWPAELDALIAAPQHHKLLFENGRTRVIDTLIPPGEETKVHTHRWPATLYIISWSDFIRYDIDGNVVIDSRTLSTVPEPSNAVWSEALIPHSLKNIGEKEIHVISCELKS